MGKCADILLHILLPNRCMFCGGPLEYDGMLCPDCEKDAPWADLSRCLLCGREECVCTREERGVDWVLAPFYYGMGSDRAVQDLKFQDNRLNARKLAYCMVRALKAGGRWNSFEVILPVPLYPADYRSRGFNQAEELAKWVSRHTGKPLCSNLLFKTRRTGKQHELSERERRENLCGAFRTRDGRRIAGKKVLLVDDVFTTGSTMRVCAEMLYRAGAAEVGCLTAAKTAGGPSGR